MNDVAWIQLVPILCNIISVMPVICDHPDWWVMLLLGVYSSHINVHESLKVFSEYNIFAVKEEGDTPQFNQAYYQAVARSDNHMIHSLLDNVRTHSKNFMSHFKLITICFHALKSMNAARWISSFKRVDMHLDLRIYFTECLFQIDSQLETS